MSHDHHDHDHHDNELDPMAARVRALETILTEKGLIDPAAIDAIVETYETKVGPRNGARVVAKAWSDPDFADWLKRDATAAIASLGFTGRQGEHMQAVFNTRGNAQPRRLHAVLLLSVVGARPAAGLVQGAALSLPRRDRSARRAGEFGLTLPADTKSASGIRPPSCAISSCRCGRQARKAGARSGSPIW